MVTSDLAGLLSHHSAPYYLRSRLCSDQSSSSSQKSASSPIQAQINPQAVAAPFPAASWISFPETILTSDYLRRLHPGSPQPLANGKEGISWD